MEFDISYTNKEVTPWGGMVFLRQMLQKIGFRELIEKNVDLPPSHHSLIAFIADVKLVANMWLRSGDTSSANNFLHLQSVLILQK
jgi:hypothetical protein